MGSWRAALGQSKTLMVKMLAATAVQDDVAIASGLLTRQDLDGAAIGRLGKIVRPFDQVELSLRWPMQSHLLWATKAVTTSLKNDKTNERPLYVALAAAMPLPVQRRSNAYADYYEAASKAVAEGRYSNLPKPSSFIRLPLSARWTTWRIRSSTSSESSHFPSWDPLCWAYGGDRCTASSGEPASLDQTRGTRGKCAHAPRKGRTGLLRSLYRSSYAGRSAERV